jgi:hypothetical protein
MAFMNGQLSQEICIWLQARIATVSDLILRAIAGCISEALMYGEEVNGFFVMGADG